MDISAKVIWGIALFVSPFVIGIMMWKCTGRWLKWIAPLIFILPASLYTISTISINRYSYSNILQSVLLAVSLYGLWLMLMLLFNALRKPKKGVEK